MSMKRVSEYYGVPAKIGGRVEYTGGGQARQGTIMGTSEMRITVRLDGAKRDLPYHPTWEMRYL